MRGRMTAMSRPDLRADIRWRHSASSAMVRCPDPGRGSDGRQAAAVSRPDRRRRTVRADSWEMPTLADLAQISDKAELISGRIVPIMPTGFRPSRIAARIYRSLDDFATATGSGYAFGHARRQRQATPCRSYLQAGSRFSHGRVILSRLLNPHAPRIAWLFGHRSCGSRLRESAEVRSSTPTSGLRPKSPWPRNGCRLISNRRVIGDRLAELVDPALDRLKARFL